MNAARSVTAGRRTAFTLVELLLVLAIIGIVTAVTMPTFVRSLRGNRLRTAARSVAAAGRYARSMAVMRQEDTSMALDLDAGIVSVSVGAAAPAAADDAADAVRPPEEQLSGALPANQQSGGISRQLDRVRIEEVTSDELEDSRSKGTFTVIYRTNGTCTPYVVRLSDAEGDNVFVRVDALSSAEIGK